MTSPVTICGHLAGEVGHRLAHAVLGTQCQHGHRQWTFLHAACDIGDVGGKRPEVLEAGSQAGGVPQGLGVGPARGT